MGNAFESISTRIAWFASEKLERYQAVQYDADGNFEVADGTRQFAGIVQYGADEAGKMVTTVQGIYPAISDGAIEAGDYVTISTGGTFVKAVQGAAAVNVYGIALTDSDDKFLFTLSMFATTTVIASA